MSEVQGPLVPLSVMDFDLTQADDTERCRAQLLIYHYVRMAPSLTRGMQQVLTEVLIYDKPWRNTPSNVPSDGTVSIVEMYSQLHTRMYFPYWFVVAVCWGPNHPALQRIRHKMSMHWKTCLPDNDVVYPGGKTLLDFDAFCGEVSTVNEEYEAEEPEQEEQEEEEEYDFGRTAENMPSLSVSSTAWRQTAPVVQTSEQILAIMETAIEALQKEMWDLKARVSVVEKGEHAWSVDVDCRISENLEFVYQNQEQMASDIAGLQRTLLGSRITSGERSTPTQKSTQTKKSARKKGACTKRSA